MLKPFGYIAVTEVSWLKNTPPKVLKEFWDREYPDINTVDNNLAIIESSGYKLINSFALSDSAWLDDFYVPLEKRLEKFRLTYHKDENALELIDKVQVEIEMFRKYSAFYGYIFYIMQNNS